MARGSTEQRDRIFRKQQESITDFSFGQETATVFDDMLHRSIPFYDEIQRMVSELVADFAADGTNIFDLGCSTGNTLMAIGKTVPKERNVRLIGIDYSEEMIEKARQKLQQAQLGHEYELRDGDLNQGGYIDNASVVLLILTLQFVRPLYRDLLLANIYRGLKPNGCVIIVEKVLGEHSAFNRLFIKHYYEMKKRQGYSELEIAQKREALENVLIPYRVKENEELLERAGFKHVDIFFKWYNFCAMIAFK